MRVKHAFLALLAVSVLAGCGGSTATSGGEATMRAFNVMTNPASIDVFTDFDLLALGLTTGQVGGYGTHNAGEVNVGARQTGSVTTLASTNFTAAEGGRYTIVTYPDASAVPAMIAVSDDFTTPAASTFKIRVLHLDRLVGNVDLYITAPGDSLGGATPVLTNIPFTGTSSYISHATGAEVLIRYTLAGTKTQVGSDLFASFNSLAVRTLALYQSGGSTAVLLADQN